MKSAARIKWIAAAVALAVLFFAALAVGRYPLSPGEVLSALLNRAGAEANAIVRGNRLPRAWVGALVGASLAVSGCAFQGLFQNPLVSQGVLGVSSGASFGAALSILLLGGAYWTPLFAFACAILAVLLSFLAARMGGEVSTLMLVLGGTVISTIFSALVSLLKYAADPYNQLASIVFWNMGSLASLESRALPYCAAAMLVGMAALFCTSGALNVLSMGEREAASIGVPVHAARAVLVAGATLATAGAVGVAGTIGWIGLIVPHIARFLIGSDNRRLLPYSALLGAAFLTAIDLLCRTLTGGEIPLGIPTALIGGPFFLYLLRRYRGGGWK